MSACDIRVMLPLMHSNLSRKVDLDKEYYAVLQCLLQPEWGLPAVTAKTELLKSGMLGKLSTAS